VECPLETLDVSKPGTRSKNILNNSWFSQEYLLLTNHPHIGNIPKNLGCIIINLAKILRKTIFFSSEKKNLNTRETKFKFIFLKSYQETHIAWPKEGHTK
jgi:hypothetical protein